MTEITILPIEEAAKIPEELCIKLFPERMKRAAKFLRREDSLRCIAAGALVASVLGVREDELGYNECGKPFLPQGNLCFSISHSGDYAVIATDGTEIGVDIETRIPIKRSVAERVFIKEELEWMDIDSEKRFLSLWTMKESIMKMDGRGFSLDPKSFSVLPLMQGEPISFEGRAVYGLTMSFPDHTVSACALHSLDDANIRVIGAEDLTEL